AHRQAHPDQDDEATFHGFGNPEAATAIDWILVSNHFSVTDATTDRSHAGPLFPSDHYPVVAVLAWKD
ncbi:MAG: endonuclease, partial [bacterium]|nr:endonuclease [bacterium]